MEAAKPAPGPPAVVEETIEIDVPQISGMGRKDRPGMAKAGRRPVKGAAPPKKAEVTEEAKATVSNEEVEKLK